MESSCKVQLFGPIRKNTRRTNVKESLLQNNKPSATLCETITKTTHPLADVVVPIVVKKNPPKVKPPTLKKQQKSNLSSKKIEKETTIVPNEINQPTDTQNQPNSTEVQIFDQVRKTTRRTNAKEAVALRNSKAILCEAVPIVEKTRTLRQQKLNFVKTDKTIEKVVLENINSSTNVAVVNPAAEEKVKPNLLKKQKETKLRTHQISEVNPEIESTQSHLLISTSLQLPANFKLLLELFRHADQIVNMIVERKQLCTFEKLKQSIEQVTRRSFSMDHLAQIIKIYSDAFFIEWRKLTPQFQPSGTAKWQLVIVPNYGDNTEECKRASQLLTRQKHFHQLLLQLVVEGHKFWWKNVLDILISAY